MSFDPLRALVIFAVGIGSFIALIYLHIKISKVPAVSSESKLSRVLQTLIAFTVLALSWVLNIGWIRIGLFFPILLHLLLFTYANRYYARYVAKSSRLFSFIHKANLGTFLLSYTFLPDGGDTPESEHVVFGLIRNHSFIDIAYPITLIVFVLNISLIVLQIRAAWQAKRAAR